MKKIIFTILVSIILQYSYSQQTKATYVITKQDYLKKSKKQKTAAWVTLGTGAVLITTGAIALKHTTSKGGREAPILLSGMVFTTASIPLFIISFATKSKGMKLSFNNQSVPQMINCSLVYNPIPSLNLKINL